MTTASPTPNEAFAFVRVLGPNSSRMEAVAISKKASVARPSVAASKPRNRPYYANCGSTPPTCQCCPASMRISNALPISHSTSCGALDNWTDFAAATWTMPRVPCDVHHPKTFSFPICASPSPPSGASSYSCTTNALPATSCSSARPANTHKCSATSPKPRCRFASLGTPCGAVALRHERILGNQPTQSAALAAGDQSARSLTTYFPGAKYRSAIGALNRLIRLQQAPPVSLLQSRVRSAAAALPKQPQ